MLDRKIRSLAGTIHDGAIREKVLELLRNPTLTIGGKTYSGLPLSISPAGLSHHHCYPGGYVEHVVSTARIALTICDSVEKVYRGKVNRDLVLAGVLLHDVFKPATYTVNENGTYGSTRLADNLDHSSLAVCELVRRGFPIELVHIVAAHHGNYSPVRPRTIEALICHLADFADSQLDGGVLDAAAYLTRKAVGQELPMLNSNEAFEIVYSKSVEGWEGVARAVEKIRRKRKTHKT